MLHTTETAARALLKCDSTIAPELIENAIQVLKCGVAEAQPSDKLVSRGEVARLLGVTPQTVTMYAKNGKLHARRLGGTGSRATGYSLCEVNAIIAGKEVA